MPRRAVSLAALLALLALPAATRAQIPAPPPSRPGVRPIAPADTSAAVRIAREIRTGQRALADLEHLADVIGPRLTGSAALVRAHAWAESTLTARGMASVHREAYDFGPAWTRGPATARLLTQNGKALTVAAAGWSPATKGAVRGDLLLVAGTTVAELERFVGTFKGKFVAFGPMPGPGADTAAVRRTRERLAQAMQQEGALALFLPSGKAEGLTMTGGPNWRFGPMIPRIPIAFTATDDYALLRRALARGERVALELDLPSTTSTKPVQAYNTVAEIKGSEKPDEVVILGAHLDSWDLGTGATDDGTGVVAVMEALRAIKAAGLAPRRTIRLVLFSGEEQGHFGSKAYAAAHRAELDHVQAVLIHDLGTGRVRGFALQGMEEARPLMAQAIAPLNDLGVVELPLEGSMDSDHASFRELGVPGFFAVQDTVDYFSTTHHSQFDTFDRVRPDDLLQGATALAVTAWTLANMPERLPHRATEAAAH